MRRLAIALILAAACSGALAATASATVKTFTFRSQPVRVSHYQVVRGGNHVPAPRMSGAITYMETHVVDETGQPMPQWQVMLHHVVFKDLGHGRDVRLDGACPGSGKRSNQRFYGTSEELRPLTLPDGYGYPISRQDRWEMGWMLMNHTKDTRTVRIQYTVRVDTAKLQPVTPYWLGVRPCGVDPQFAVPGGGAPGSIYSRALTWRIPAAGRIVAVGGHLHGGSHGITLRQPRCGNRTLTTNQPTYAMPDDPLYQIYPPLHEPDPKRIAWWQSATGIPVKKGEKLRVTASYRDDYPYMRVMGIDHVYIAHGKAPGTSGCPPLPADAQVLGPDFVGRDAPPHTELTLAQMSGDGSAQPIDGLPGPVKQFDGNASVVESGTQFRTPKLSIPAGATVRWSFHDRDLHDATLVTGPRGFSSPPMWGGSFAHRFTVPGEYRIYCSVHPVKMSQVLTVRPSSR